MVKTYLSHYIRGPKGNEATDEDMDRNRAAASLVGKQLSILVPELELYVPADHDVFVAHGWRAGILTEKIVLDVDCYIIEQGELVLFHDPAGVMKQSRGMMRELRHTQEIGLPYLIFQNVNSMLVEEINILLDEVNINAS